MSSQSQWSQLGADAPAANKCTICGRDDFDCQQSLRNHKKRCTNFSFASTQSASAAAYNFSGGKLRNNTVVRKYSKWKDKFEKEAKSRGKKHEYMDDRISHLKKRQRLCHKSKSAEEDSDSDDSETPSDILAAIAVRREFFSIFRRVPSPGICSGADLPSVPPDTSEIVPVEAAIAVRRDFSIFRHVPSSGICSGPDTAVTVSLVSSEGAPGDVALVLSSLQMRSFLLP